MNRAWFAPVFAFCRVSRAAVAVLGLVVGLALTVGVGSAGLAPSVGLSQTPWLRLDTGMHTGAIRDIALDPSGELVATAGIDKAIRIWSLANGALISTIRPFVSEGEIGQVESVVFMPNGQAILAGSPAFDSAPGLRQGSVYLFRLDQSPPMRLPSLVAPVNRLFFAPAGDRFAGTMLSGGITVWSSRGQRLFQERIPGREFVDADIGPFGLMVTALNDGSVQLRDPVTYGISAVYQGEGGGRPFSVSINEEGTLLAVGYSDRPHVDILAMPDMRLEQRLSLPDAHEGNLAVVAWGLGPSSDGLFAAGTVTTANAERLLAFWRDPGEGGSPALVPIARDSVTALAAAPDGGVVFAASDPTWGRIVINGEDEPELLYAPRPRRLGFREHRDEGLAVAADGAVVAFRATSLHDLTQRDARAVRFDLDGLRLEEVGIDEPLRDSAVTAGSAGVDSDPDADTDTDTVTVELEAEGGTVRVSGNAVRLDSGERALSTALAADHGSIWLGTDFFLRQVSPEGESVASVLTPGPVWSVAAAGSDTAVATLGDGTIRWYRRQDGSLIEQLALFVHADRRRWVAWRPDGTFAHSERGVDDLIGFQINGQAGDLSSAWYDLSQLYEVYFQPDGVRAALSDDAEDAGTVGTVFADLSLPEIEWLGYCGVEAGNQVSAGADFLDERAATRALSRVQDQPSEPVSESRQAGAADCTDLGTGTRGLARVAAAAIAEPTAGEASGEMPEQSGAAETEPAPGSLAPGDPQEWGPEWAELLFAVTDGGGGVETIDVFVNGRNAGRTDATRALVRRPDPESEAIDQPEDRDGRVIVRRFVQLDPGNNEILLRAYTSDGVFSRSDRIVVRGPRPEPEPEPPKLYVFSVGIDAYQGAITPLNYAVADAVSVANTVRATARHLYDAVEIELVLNEDARSDMVLERFAQFTEPVRQEDALVVYFAGHGVTDDEGDYIFVTHDVENRGQLASHAISQDALISALSTVPAQNLFLFLDTCYSGTFDLEVGGKIAAESGRFVLTASTSVQEALDSFDGRNGVFARAVLDGVEGGAPATGTVIDALFLGAYVRDRVPELAERRAFDQSAVFKTAGGEIRPFPFAVAEP